MRRSPRYLLASFALLGLVAVGCSDDSKPSAAPVTTVAASAVTSATPTTTTAPVTGNITVLAASSLTESFKALGTAFEAANPGSKVTFSFGASSTLVTQINQGAPADVFASADTANMDKLTAATGAGITGSPVTFAKNKLEIIVGKGNPKTIAGVADLAKPGVLVVNCSPDVPIGKYSQQVLDQAKVTVTPKSLEPDVKSIVSKVTLGEADAGIVYATDVQAAGDKAEGVVIPDDLNVIATYPIAETKAVANAPTAAAFVAFVASPAGQAILAKYGFSAP
jgi:molybdate transport system substrate-binding protein